jgi:hypothetical protein
MNQKRAINSRFPYIERRHAAKSKSITASCASTGAAVQPQQQLHIQQSLQQPLPVTMSHAAARVTDDASISATAKQVIVNECLSYITFFRNCGNEATIRKIGIGFFLPDKVSDTIQLLMSILNVH